MVPPLTRPANLIRDVGNGEAGDDDNDSASRVNATAAAIVVVIVLLFVGLLIGSAIVRRKILARHDNRIKSRRIGRPELWTIDGEKDNPPRYYSSDESLLKEGGGSGFNSTSFSNLGSLPYAHGVENPLAVPPKAVTNSPMKKLRILSGAFMTQIPNETMHPNRQVRYSQSSSMTDMTETWTRINLHTSPTTSTRTQDFNHSYITSSHSEAQRATLARQSSIHSLKAEVSRPGSVLSNRAEFVIPPWDPSLTIARPVPAVPAPASPLSKSSLKKEIPNSSAQSQPQAPLITFSPASPVVSFTYI